MDDATYTKKLALDIRIHALKMLANHGMGHVGGSLSVADAIAVLYGGVMRYNPENPQWEERDYLVLSKGHCGPALYAALALTGFFPVDELYTINKLGTRLPSHVDKNKTPGIDMTAGSLGQGVSCALGMALGLKMESKSNTVYAIIGDGESQEGQVWETFLIGAAKKADNLIVMLDNNKQQLDDFTINICNLGDMAAKVKEFGWHTEDVDGHDVQAIASAIEACKKSGKPGFINMNTVKGKGWPEKESINGNHGVKGMTLDSVKDVVACLQAEMNSLS